MSTPMNRGHTCTVEARGDREIVITRVFAAPRRLVFAALTTPQLVRRWLLGPSGSSMTVCEIDPRVGRPYRYLWRRSDGVEIGMRGTFREVAPPERLVATEIIEEAGHCREAVGTSMLVEHNGTTTLTTTVVYESREARDAVIASSMADGVAAGYETLKGLLALPTSATAGNRGVRLARIAAGLTLMTSTLGSAHGWSPAATPNFSGRWVLNLAKTQQARLDPPRWRCCASGPTVVTIDHQEPRVTITTETVGVDYRGKTANHVKLVETLFTDGRETFNINPAEFKIDPDGREYYQEDGRPRVPSADDYYDLARHEYRTLVVRSVSSSGSARVWRWSMAADGRELTARVYFNDASERTGKPKTTLVFARGGR